MSRCIYLSDIQAVIVWMGFIRDSRCGNDRKGTEYLNAGYEIGACKNIVLMRQWARGGVYIVISFIGIRTLCDQITRGYGDHSSLTRPKEEVTHGGRGW